MLKEMGYQEKIEMITPWLEEVVDVVKKDLKNEHLKIDRNFCKKYFLGKNASNVSLKEMAEAYKSDISAGNGGLGEFIATRWLLKNTDIYGYFEERLKTVTINFEELSELPQEVSLNLMHSSVKLFGAKKTYLFSVFNSVVFPAALYAELKESALSETKETQAEQAAHEKAESLENLQLRHNREMAAIADRYEKKFSGLQKKYLNDVDALKKQIRNLQKKLNLSYE